MDVGAAFRSANDRIAEEARSLDFDGPIPFLCECDDATCHAIVRLDAAGYAESRSSGTPITLPHHRVRRPIVVDSPAVRGRDERVARNEAMYRAVNREIEYAAQQHGDGPADELDIVCECGEPACAATITLTIAEYDEIHRERDRFAVAPGHENPELEHVVKRTDDYLVVDKFGAAEDVAEEEERREGTT
ncbi:MAG TPA: hypothetical protein VF101_07485 [Gaiellaceae bacterium]